jgi:hypothetical protein
MFNVRNAGGALAVIFCIALITTNAYAQSGVTGGTVRGQVFFDVNENALFDEGDIPLKSIDLGFTDGSDNWINTTTAEDGNYTVQLDPGLWRISIPQIEGYEVLEGVILEALIEQIEQEQWPEITLDIPLRMTLPQEASPIDGEPNTQDPDVVAPQSEDSPDTESDASTQDPDDEAQEDEGEEEEEEEEDDESEGLYILPESGGKIPSRWIDLLGFGGILVASLILILIGRRMIRT